MEGYKTIYRGATSEITEKKSRFIANVFHVEAEDEALYIIEQLKKKYWDASHNCYAYIVGIKTPIERCSDDGEPAKTAGRPMLDVLIGEELHNTLVVVTRYFGGTLLGTGGLVRAYQSAAKAGIAGSVVIERLPAKKIEVTTDYNSIGKLQYLADQYNIPILGTEYTDKVVCTLLTDDMQQSSLSRKMLEATSGQVKIEILGEVLYARNGKELLLFNN